MPIITLPDQSKHEFNHSISVLEIAQQIGAGLAKAAIAGKVNGQLVDLDYMVDRDATVAIMTEKDPEGLEMIRHSTAHVLAHAVQSIFPQAQVTIGPVIENGFYYDFAFERSFTPEDLEKIENKMGEIVKQDLPIQRIEISREEAIKKFKEMGENYKVEIIQAIPEAQVISLYKQGDFVDLCRGPHVPSTGKLKAFKLTKVAGAYWRGDSNNEMLQRIYGVAFANKKELDLYVHRLEEAEKRDHRKLGKIMDLFHFQDEAPGMVYWHNNGWIIYQEIIQYMRQVRRQHNYLEVNTPIMADRVLWEKSGHWEKYQSHMFTTSSENRDYAIKPMNCPGHLLIYNQGLKSYRDLPYKIGEFGLCHRNEASGTLHGLMRIRAFTQDDAHIFCMENQLQHEIGDLIDMVHQTYHDFGFKEVLIRLATRPTQRIGSDEDWDRAEKALENALKMKGLKYELAQGDGAFYGPKYEFHLKDCLGRMWQCGTIQIDFSMPNRLGAIYVAEDGTRKAPVMIHLAVFGSLERFIGVLLEHYAGKLPLWLAPEQVMVMNITDHQADFARKVVDTLKKHGFRAKYDLRNEKIGFKIREHSITKIPYLVIIGDRELENEQVSVRTQAGEDLGSMSLDQFIERLQKQVRNLETRN